MTIHTILQAVSSFGALIGGQLPVRSTNLACFLEAIEAGCTNTGNDTVVQQDNIDKENDSATKLDVSSSMEKPSGQGPEESILESDVIKQGMSLEDMTKEKDLNTREATESEKCIGDVPIECDKHGDSEPLSMEGKIISGNVNVKNQILREHLKEAFKNFGTVRVMIIHALSGFCLCWFNSNASILLS
jgi:hypothetical protein